jgi:hypothetical protein
VERGENRLRVVVRVRRVDMVVGCDEGGEQDAGCGEGAMSGEGGEQVVGERPRGSGGGLQEGVGRENDMGE